MGGRRNRYAIGAGLRLLLIIAGCQLSAALAPFLAAPGFLGWYARLNKPAWSPPDWTFPVFRTAAYVGLGFVLWRLVERVPKSPARDDAITALLAVLAFTAVSPVIVLAFWQVGLGAVSVMVVLVLMLVAIVTARKVDAASAVTLLAVGAWGVWVEVYLVTLFLMNR